ncbi:alpha/beta fold hydrolase [Synechococcus sp. PCC 7336]|uniref:alpha/beta fold hydrolase n=1 Tax=Synechococcus sp. PCC 7336 TaxID=195250 RepID=UPI00034CA4B9|nr:alpha/beta hydrolase [Synechococcus sp. PCC 7336]
MPYLDIDSSPHYYEWIVENGGDAPTGDRPVMVFLHGWGGSARYWEATARALSDTYDCLLYDLRGFGRSSARSLQQPIPFADPRHAAYALEHYATELKELVDALHLDRISIQAHSMGSSIAALFISQTPERVDRAIFACGGIFEYNALVFGLFQQIGSTVVRIRPQWLSRIPGMDRMTIARFVHKMPPAQVRQAFLADYMQADIPASLGTLYTSVSKHASVAQPEAFRKIQRPTLIVSGEKDIIIPSALGRMAAELNPEVRHVELPEVAHLPMLECPDEYLATVRQFLAH